MKENKPATPPSKQRFIEALAHFLVDDASTKTIALVIESMRDDADPRPNLAREWQLLRASTPVFGWVTYEEAVRELTRFLE